MKQSSTHSPRSLKVLKEFWLICCVPKIAKKIVQKEKARPVGAALGMNSAYVSSVAIGVGRMGHEAEEYIWRRDNRLEEFGTKGRIDKGWRRRAESAGEKQIPPHSASLRVGMTMWLGWRIIHKTNDPSSFDFAQDFGTRLRRRVNASSSG